MEELTNKELAQELEKIQIRLSKDNQLHAYDEAVLMQAKRRIENKD